MGWDRSSMLPDFGDEPEPRMRADALMHRRLAALLATLRYAFGPVRHTERIVGWWPTVTSVTAVAAAVAYVLKRSTPLLIAAALLIVAGLFLRAALHFYLEAHPDFPRHHLDIEPPWFAMLPDVTNRRRARALHLPVEFINREETRPAILQFDLFWSWGGIGPYSLSHFRGTNLPDSLPETVTVPPQRREQGAVVFDAEFALGFDYGEDVDKETGDVSVKDRYTVFLRVTDKLTRASIERSVPQRRGGP